MNTEQVKDFLLFIVKSPALWVALIALVNANQKWLFPNIPPQVMDSFNNFVTVVSGLVVAYLSGGYVKEHRMKANAARLLVEQYPLQGEKLELKENAR